VTSKLAVAYVEKGTGAAAASSRNRRPARTRGCARGPLAGGREEKAGARAGYARLRALRQAVPRAARTCAGARYRLARVAREDGNPRELALMKEVQRTDLTAGAHAPTARAISAAFLPLAGAAAADDYRRAGRAAEASVRLRRIRWNC
jgi:hypothetical protein